MQIKVSYQFARQFERNPQSVVKELHSIHGTTRVCPEIEPGSIVLTKGGDSASDIVVILGH